jgi:hypothetical protein
MAKKSFKNDIQGADKLFSANDQPETEKSEKDDVNMSENVLNNTLINAVNEEKNNGSSNAKNNILDSILSNIKEEPKGRNYTFYLSNEVAAAIMETAKKNSISNSKLVDSILKKVLFDA